MIGKQRQLERVGQELISGEVDRDSPRIVSLAPGCADIDHLGKKRSFG